MHPPESAVEDASDATAEASQVSRNNRKKVRWESTRDDAAVSIVEEGSGDLESESDTIEKVPSSPPYPRNPNQYTR